MGKKKQFDENEVLAVIAEYFWLHGYNATKVDQLSAITNLTKTSLYNAFGNKAELFKKSIDYFVSQQLKAQFQLIDMKKSLSENIEVLLNERFSRDKNNKISHGCMLINSLLELAGNEPVLLEVVNKHLSHARSIMLKFFTAYKKDQRLNQSVDVEKLTDFFMTNLQGLRVQSRMHESTLVLCNSIEVFITYIKALENNN
ncbi:MAG: TetR/AcrR family transcriptional regulator [Colwellia polaris]|jgi:TetR/AcrR family transcriptional repressor of nem operon|uniref:TetR/AcrR family transcriptional regulator n=1 Tax=Colwellia polaris TaxID=326537 RepID=UPI000A16DBAC|nr:TetR/AcrR family transcriptional regulator [Colwellia polaris]|tara:strand:- start:1666 stop:2265 length:600 start_codon:yes stop_codon:yes gene_type:complete